MPEKMRRAGDRRLTLGDCIGYAAIALLILAWLAVDGGMSR